MFHNTISGSIAIGNDPFDLIGRYPIIGNETVKVRLASSKDASNYDIDFNVFIKFATFTLIYVGIFSVIIGILIDFKSTSFLKVTFSSELCKTLSSCNNIFFSLILNASIYDLINDL